MSTGPFLGMDVDAVEGFAGQLDQKASEIDNLRGHLTGQLKNTPWVGTDSNTFNSDWDSRLAPDLVRVAEALREAATKARANAADQRSTSSAV